MSTISVWSDKMDGKRIIQILISIALLGILIYWIDLDQLWHTLLNANLLFLGLALVITTVNRILMALKWNVLLRAQGIYLSWYEVTKIYYTSSFLGVFLPPTVGLDAVKTYYVTTKTGDSVPRVLSSILIERVLGMLTLLIYGIIGGVIFVTMYAYVELEIMNLLWMFILLAVLGAGTFVLSLSKSLSSRVLKVFERFQDKSKYLKKTAGQLERLYRSYQIYSRKKGTLAVFVVLTCVENALPIVRSFIIAIALHAYVPLSYFFVIVPIALLLIRLPISFDGFGIHEGVFVYFLALIGISKDVGFSIGLTNHLVFLIALLPGWVFYLSGGMYKKTTEGLARISA